MFPEKLLPSMLQGKVATLAVQILLARFLCQPDVEQEGETSADPNTVGKKTRGRPKKGSTTVVKATGKYGGQKRDAAFEVQFLQQNLDLHCIPGLNFRRLGF